jgi:hypothetical protein
MVSPKAIAAVAALALLAACEARIGKDEQSAETKSVAGKAEEGSFSIKVPGFNMKLDIPEGLANRAEIDSDSEIFYPGSKMRGIHIEAGEGEGRNGVELRFTNPDPPAKVASWYRSSDRSADFTIASAREEGGGYLLSGTQKDDGDPFVLQLRPAGGGTDARLTFQDKN